MSPLNKKIIIIVLAIGFIGLFLLGIFYYQTAIRRGEPGEVSFVIEKGESVKTISQNLFDKELIGSKKFFELFVWWSDKQTKLQAGEYLLNPGETISQIVDKLGNAKASTIEIKIKEGQDIEDIASNLEVQGLFAKNDFYKETGNLFSKVSVNQEYAGKYGILADKPQNSSLEGYLFPDTYQVYKNATPKDVVEKMLKNLDAKFSVDLLREYKKKHEAWVKDNLSIDFDTSTSR
ncbi:MAG: YceG family protein [Candidatus Falkowbacteria bacterium GW2011_GWF2_39_8]|uniref:YceG family protein n=1 Tax=Candidatus Falkowbacteria bacterium GW2011_GWF2_39_8 TaxID=1618642 RepID=A0A0G0S920_9BACT|nr:MAG: YceG family protein [Candidatus Falkowbacteria bacterium GW2011_GWF2_39_8]